MKVLVDRLGRVLSSPLFDDRFGAGRGLNLRDVVLRCACAIGLGVSLAPVAVMAAVPAIPVVVAVPFSPTNPLFMASQLPLVLRLCRRGILHPRKRAHLRITPRVYAADNLHSAVSDPHSRAPPCGLQELQRTCDPRTTAPLPQCALPRRGFPLDLRQWRCLGGRRAASQQRAAANVQQGALWHPDRERGAPGLRYPEWRRRYGAR